MRFSIRDSKATKCGKKKVDKPIRSLDQLLPNGKVPSVRGGGVKSLV